MGYFQIENIRLLTLDSSPGSAILAVLSPWGLCALNSRWRLGLGEVGQINTPMQCMILSVIACTVFIPYAIVQRTLNN